jgi:pimeloyl-ACP methyl ester carboxylesterase
MPTININGTGLEYRDEGAGRPVVFVHGSLSDLRSWSSQLSPFANKYRAVTFSCRHYFPNEQVADDVELPLATFVDDLAALLRALDLAPAHLVGQSSGALVAMLLSLQSPELVRSLVLAEPPALPLLGVDVPPKPTQLLRLLARDPRTAVAVMKFGARGIGPAIRAFERDDDERGVTAFVAAVVGRETLDTWSQERRQRLLDNVGAFKAVLRAGLPPFNEDDAHRIRAPSLLVTGAQSAPVLHKITDRLQRSIPNVERIDIPHASHLMFEDRPEDFNQAVLAFIDRCDEAAPV